MVQLQQIIEHRLGNMICCIFQNHQRTRISELLVARPMVHDLLLQLHSSGWTPNGALDIQVASDTLHWRKLSIVSAYILSMAPFNGNFSSMFFQAAGRLLPNSCRLWKYSTTLTSPWSCRRNVWFLIKDNYAWAWWGPRCHKAGEFFSSSDNACWRLAWFLLELS